MLRASASCSTKLIGKGTAPNVMSSEEPGDRSLDCSLHGFIDAGIAGPSQVGAEHRLFRHHRQAMGEFERVVTRDDIAPGFHAACSRMAGPVRRSRKPITSTRRSTSRQRRTSPGWVSGPMPCPIMAVGARRRAKPSTRSRIVTASPAYASVSTGTGHDEHVGVARGLDESIERLRVAASHTFAGPHHRGHRSAPCAACEYLHVEQQARRRRAQASMHCGQQRPEPDPSPYRRQRHRPGAKRPQTIGRIRQDLECGIGPERAEPLERDLQHRRIAEIEVMVSVRFDQNSGRPHLTSRISAHCRPSTTTRLYRSAVAHMTRMHS